MKTWDRLACEFDFDQSLRKSTQVHASPGQTESQVDPSFQLASTCESVWSGLKQRNKAAFLNSSGAVRGVSSILLI